MPKILHKSNEIEYFLSVKHDTQLLFFSSLNNFRVHDTILQKGEV